jgi:hypothetical protein
MIYFDEKYLTIHWDETIQCIVMDWKGWPPTRSFGGTWRKSLELIKKRSARK